MVKKIVCVASLLVIGWMTGMGVCEAQQAIMPPMVPIQYPAGPQMPMPGPVYPQGWHQPGGHQTLVPPLAEQWSQGWRETTTTAHEYRPLNVPAEPIQAQYQYAPQYYAPQQYQQQYYVPQYQQHCAPSHYYTPNYCWRSY